MNTFYKSLLQEFSHELVDLLWSILLHPVTAVSNVPTEEERCRFVSGYERQVASGYKYHPTPLILANTLLP